MKIDWKEVAHYVLLSRELDDLEEKQLTPDKQPPPGKMVKYQFSAMGHELAQVLLALALDHPHDGVNAYYRSRPFMLASGYTARAALAGGMARTGGASDGRDVGVTYNLPRKNRAVVLPMSGDVGSQYTPAAGWAQAIHYRARTLGEKDWEGAIAGAFGGDGSVASNGFWSALTIATTLKLPMLFFIEDNGYGISVPSVLQTPNGNIAANLASFGNLLVLDGDGTDPRDASEKIARAVQQLRGDQGPVLLRLRVPRLRGHTYGEDARAYKTDAQIQEEQSRDPVPRLKDYLLKNGWSEKDWNAALSDVREDLSQALDEVEKNPMPDPATVAKNVFFEDTAPMQGGLRPENAMLALGTATPQPSGARMNFLDAVRRTLQSELQRNPRLLIFGEDVGPRGGVHRVTVDLQKEFGIARVFDTSLSEEGILGRAQGMALAGLLPVPEIQFRKYLDPAMEQFKDIGTARWRTAGKFAAPMVVRIPGGYTQKNFGALGDPWHSENGEAIFAHTIGWRVAYASNAEDAVGLLRTALRGDDPTIFFEHRALLDTEPARRPYPGDDYCLPFGVANILTQGAELTVVTWGQMVYRCLEAASVFANRVSIIDLRTITPWDKETVLQSLRQTGKLLIAHEDAITGGFAGEIIATMARDAFEFLDAPMERLGTLDIPVPFNVELMNAMLPSVEMIREKMDALLKY